MQHVIVWRIDYYESPVGNKPVEEFIHSLEEKTQTKVVRALELLEEFGIQVGPSHTKKVIGTQMWELRILGTDNIRVFYIAKKQRSFLLLHGFQKKTKKTEKKEIQIAIKRLNEYTSRKTA